MNLNFTAPNRPWAILAVVLATACGCAARREVSRLPADTVTDLSGRWNDTDSREVSDEMIEDCLNGNWIVQHAAATAKRPVVIVGTIQNRTLEHIPTGTFVADLERAMLTSGKVEVVATASERGELRYEKEDQWANATVDTASRMGMERGADYMLIGTVQSIEDREGGTKVVFYQVDMTLVDIESSQKVWIGQTKIKKGIRQARYTP